MRSEGGSPTSLAFLDCGETDLSLGHSALVVPTTATPLASVTFNRVAKGC